MRIAPFALAVTLIAVLAAAAAAAASPLTIISDVGDRDGFNGVYDPDTQSLPFRFQMTSVPANGAGEAAFTDKQTFDEQSDSPTYSHSFVLPEGFTITAATFEIVTFDNASGANFDPRHSGRIFLDGVELQRSGQDFFHDAVGDTFGGADGSLNDGAAELFQAAIPGSMFVLLADGAVDVLYTDSGFNDGAGVDYVRLTIEGATAVPEPAASALALALLFALRRRKTGPRGPRRR